MILKRTFARLALALALAAGTGRAQTPAPGNASGDIVVRIVAAESPDRLVSDLEAIAAVGSPGINTSSRLGGAQTAPSSGGDDTTVWVKGARVDGTNTFERYYKGEFTYRKSELTFAAGRLNEGEHIVDPGRHVFRIDKDGKLSSTDPDIVIEGRTVSLKAYRTEFMSADGNLTGPPEVRLLARPLNVDELRPAFDPSAAKFDASNVVNTLSHYRSFCPLRLYLPANTNELAYALRPGDQRFRILPGGALELQGKPNPVIKADGSKLVLSYRSFYGWVRSKTGVGASFGGTIIPETDTKPARIRVGPINGEPMFLATTEGLSKTFGLQLSGDMDKYPYKFMVVENMRDPMALRMMALESGACVFERGNSATVRLQFKENTAALKREDLRKVAPLVEALRAAMTNTPVAKDDLFGLQVRRVCKYLLVAANKGETEAVAKWLATPDPGAQMGAMDGGIAISARINALLNESTFFNAAALTDLKADDGLRKDAAGMATLDPDALQRLNRRILDLVVPGAFAPAQADVARPQVRLVYAPYDPVHSGSRSWTSSSNAVEKWEGDTLTLKTPDVPYGFYMFRVMLFGPYDKDSISPLTAEFPVCVIEPKQQGTLAFVSNKGRDAFVQGETIRLDAVFRSKDTRPAGNRTVVLKHPDGREDRLTVKDAGGKWHSQPLSISESITRRLAPGHYELTAADLPAGLACYPFRFDVAPPRESLYRMIKTGGVAAGDAERAVATLADVGYNRLDFFGSDKGPEDVRAALAQDDERLMSPDTVDLPSAKNQLLNACVRYGLEYGGMLHGQGDNEIPRYIDGYINAAERWIRREVTSMRHSPAYDGEYLYWESYYKGLTGVPKNHDTFFPAWRLKRAMAVFTNPPPNQIKKDIGKNMMDVKTSPDKWDQGVMDRYLDYCRWEEHSWGDFNSRVSSAGRELLPLGRFGTVHCSFMFVQSGRGAVMSAADLDNGYHPDVFENLEIASCQHYHDGPTLGYWINSPIMIQLMRESPAGRRRLVWANISMNKAALSLSDGQLQRQMAFAMLAQGADGYATFLMPESFSDGPNPSTLKGKETMRQLNTEILAPFGEVYARGTKPGYLKVGIVNTLAQLEMSDFKPIRTANQLEELWLACWRLGYPAVFLREGDLEQPIEGYQAIFVPGIRFPGELTSTALEQLRSAIKRGCKVIVERDSTLDTQLEGVTKMTDFDLMNYFIGPGFNVAGYDAELDKVYTLSQPCTDYLRTKMVEWGIEPAARGPFTVGPNWRDGGGIQYLIMSNYEDPDYGQTCRDIMSKPGRVTLSVPASRGAVAYDLLAKTELPLGKTEIPLGTTNAPARSVVLDMTRVQGALAAFLPEKIAALRIATRRDAAGSSLLLNGSLVGESGKTVSGVFPTRIRLLDGKGNRIFSIYRVLDSNGEMELAIPLTSGRDGAMTLEVTENISGKMCSVKVESGAATEPVLRLDDAQTPYVPYPSEVARFVKSNTNAILVLGRGLEGSKAEVDRLIAGLGAKGVKVALMPENRAWRVAAGDPSITGCPTADGFHGWDGDFYGNGGQPLIGPGTVVDSPLIILSSARGSMLLNTLVDAGFVTQAPVGFAGLAVQPTLQVASRGLHWKYDTLLMVANDAEGVRSVVSRVLEEPVKTGGAAGEAAAKPKAYGQPEKKDGRETPEQKSAMSFMGNNEYVLDLKFDGATNLYMITWGHGDNLYSLDPQGKLRFSRRLPEMGACRLDIDTDRVVVFTGFGSRLYQIKLDGTPISQALLPLDPGSSFKGPTYRECYTADLFKHGMGLTSELFRYAYVPESRRIVYYEWLLETMRVLDENYNVIAEWRGESTAGTGGDTTLAKLGDFVCSPDGTRVAQMEDDSLVLREIVPGTSGAVGSARKVAQRYRGAGALSWQKGELGPTVGLTHYGPDLEALRVDLPAPVGTVLDLGGATGLIADGKDLRLVRTMPEGAKEISRLGPFPWIPTFAKISPDGRTVVLLDEYWTAFVHEVETGRRTAQIKLPEMGFVLEFAPDSKSFLVGGLRGAVMSYDISGKPLWSTTLAAHNESLKKTEFPNVDPAIPDRTDKLFAVVTDEPGEVDKLVTLDQSRLVNGDGEGTGGWQVATNAGVKVAAPVYADGGYQGKRSLKVGEALVQQQVEGLIGEHFTWVLEFFYRSAAPEKNARLLAGLAVENRHPSSVVRVLPCDKDWKFARIVTKSGADPKAVRVGFQGQGGEALVDNVTLRRIRFPSVNHMLYPPVYDVEPIILKNPLFMKDYNPLGVLREQIPNIILSERPAQIADALVVDAFMQNGRLNDICSLWHWSYLSADTLIAMGIRNPRWVSMVAIYFNAYDEANTARHFDVYVSDIDSKRLVLVASVRNNRSLFRLIKFPPRRADEVRVVLRNALPRQRTVTEMEVYGPLSGSESSGFVDAAGQNTYMGSFSRVEKRRLEVAPGYEEKAVNGRSALPRWAPPVSQVMMSERNLYLSRSPGFNQRLSLDSSDESFFRTGSLGFGPTPTLYGGALMKPGTDGMLWCVDPESGRAFWSTALGERLAGSPAAIGLDVFMATDAGKCYTLDIASGAILGEQKLAGPVYGSVATDGTNVYVITSGGTATCFHAKSGTVLWNVEIAPNTESTPAVDDGVVFMADRQGTARAVQSADGKLLWKRELGSEFSRCPVVLPDLVVFGCLDGRLTALNRRTGEQVWQTQVDTRFMRYDPVPMVLPPAAPAASASNAVSEAEAAPTGAAVPVLLCVSAGKVQLLDAATGQPAARQIAVGSMDGKGNFKGKDGLPGIGGEVTAPIGSYAGYLAFAAVNDDGGDAPLYGLPDVYGEHRGLVKLFKPITDTPPKKAGGPRPIAFAQAPIRMDAPITTNEWGSAILSLNGPDAIFPEDRRKKGSLDGATVWTDFGDLGAQLYMTYDSNWLYVAAVVADDKHVNKAENAEDIAKSDCLQIGILALKPKSLHWNLGLALTDKGVLFDQAEGGTNHIEMASEFSVSRADRAKTTTYKLKMPLTGLGLTPDSEFGFNAVIKDDDTGDGARYWLQSAPGLADRNDAKWPLDKTYPRYTLTR